MYDIRDESFERWEDGIIDDEGWYMRLCFAMLDRFYDGVKIRRVGSIVEEKTKKKRTRENG